jgi:hypothetical protein
MSVTGNRERIYSEIYQAIDKDFGSAEGYAPGGIYDPYSTGDYARQRDIEE